MPSGRPKKPKTCVACGKEFQPSSNRVTRCDECKRRAPRQPRATSGHEKPKRSKLTVSKMMQIDASVAARVAAMPDEEEEDDEAA